MNRNAEKRWILLCAGGIAAGLPFVFPILWPLSCIAPIILLHGIYRAESMRSASLQGFVFGALSSGLAVSWLWEALPLDWLVESALVGIFLTAATWVLTTLALALGTSAFSALAFAMRTGMIGDVILIPIAWVLGEELRMWSYAVLSLAPNSIFGAHFSIGAIGYPLAEFPLLLQLADPGGIRSLSFFAVLIASMIFFVFRARNLRKRVLLIIFFSGVCVAMLAPALMRESESQSQETLAANVTVINTQTPMVPSIELRLAYRRFLKEAAQSQQQPETIIYPEGVGLSSMFTSESERQSFLHELFGERNVTIISTALADLPEGKKTPQIQYYGTTQGLTGTYDKIFLVPQGESVPYISSLLASPFDSPKIKKHADVDSMIVPGTALFAGVSSGGLRIGTLDCGEIVSPDLYPKLTKEFHPAYLVNLSSQAWFHGSRILHGQTVELAKVHAVQNRLPFVVAANESPSFVIGSTGAMQAQMPWGTEGILYATLRVRK